MNMRTEKIKVDRVSLGTLMHQMEQGELRIPRFQREFVWERSRIQKLLDSMYKEYPIGTLFFWQAPKEYNHLLRNVVDLGQPALSSKKSYTFILDGQQRLISLYAVTKGLNFEGEDYGKIVVDLAISDPRKRLSFQYRQPDGSRWIAIRDLLSIDHYSIYDSLSAEYRQRFVAYRELLNNYPFSVVIVSEMNIEDAIEIFERINQQGKRLSRYDLISASIITDDFDLREQAQRDIVDVLNPKFGPIAETSIPQALALNIKGNTEYATQMNLDRKEVQDAWKKTVECFILAAEFSRDNLGVAHVDFLPYDAILPVLSYYFFYAKTRTVLSPEHREQLERWFWRVTFSERYSSASQTRMTEDAAAFRQLIDNNKRLEFPPITTEADVLFEASMRNSASAMRNGILCMLNLRHPRHFENGQEFRISINDDQFSSFTSAEKHHVFPASFLRELGYETKWVHRIPNFCFIPAELNARISNHRPSEYMSRIAEGYDDIHEFEKVMSSHFIPIDENSGIWTDDYEQFLKQRARLMADEIRKLCGVTVHITDEDRNPVIDAIEVALRETIHTQLSNAYGPNYWRECIPGDIHKNVMRLIDDYVKKTPGASRSQFDDLRLRLDFCDPSDYPKIICSNSNWRFFETIFRSKQECEQVLRDFKDYRNATKHVREIDTIKDHRGQAAIIWLARTLEIDLSYFGIY